MPIEELSITSMARNWGDGHLVVSKDFGMVTSAVATITVVSALNCQHLVYLTCTNSAVGSFQVSANGQQGSLVCTLPSGSTLPIGVRRLTTRCSKA